MTTGHPLVRQPVQPHPWWRPHKWRPVHGTVDTFGLARQCTRCWVVEVWDGITDTTIRVTPDHLRPR